VIVSAVLVDDSGPIEEAGIGPLSLAKVKGIDPGERSLTYGFQAWREAKGLDFTYDQISGQS